MNTEFHRIATTIAFNAMPEGFREKFLQDFSFDLLLEYVDVPYTARKFGEPEDLHLGHSYKLTLKGRDLHRAGETGALDEIVTLAKGAETLAKEGKHMLVRYNIAKGAHYIVDLGTFPHVVDGSWDKYHTKFEDQAAHWLKYNTRVIEDLVRNYSPIPMRSVQNRCRAIAEEAFFDAMDFLPTYKRNGCVTDLQWASLCCKQVYALMDWFSTFLK